jgi:hypothetical protein
MAYTPPVGDADLALTGEYTAPVGAVNLALGDAGATVGELSGAASGAASLSGTLLRVVEVSGASAGTATASATGSAILLVAAAGIAAGEGIALGRLAGVEKIIVFVPQPVYRRSKTADSTDPADPLVAGVIRAWARGSSAVMARLEAWIFPSEPEPPELPIPGVLQSAVEGRGVSAGTLWGWGRLAGMTQGEARIFGALRGWATTKALIAQANGQARADGWLDDGDLLDVALVIASLD